MKTQKQCTVGIFTVIIAITLVLCATCAGSPVTGGDSIIESPVFAGDNGNPESQAFTGEDVTGKSITILPPRGTGLTEAQAYLPDLVANELVSNFSSYSAMTLFDRVNNQTQYDELLSGYYDDTDAAGLDLGHLASTDYMLLGTITKTSTGYALQLTVNRNSDKTTVASHSATVTVAELDNLSGVRRASFDLLRKMGVRLGAQAQAELNRVAASGYVNAQTAQARGIAAQRNGTIIEALAYYYDALSLDPSLPEVESRLSALTSYVSSGEIGEDIGEDIRSDIQRRNEWKALLDEAENFFQEHPPFEIVYNPALQQGRIDYEKETMELSCALEVRPTNGFRVLETIRKGLIETGKMEEWGFSLWPLHQSNMFAPYSDVFTNYPARVVATLDIAIVAGLFNEQGEQLADVSVDVSSKISFHSFNKEPGLSEMRRPLPKGYLGNRYSNTHDAHVVDTARFSVNHYQAKQAKGVRLTFNSVNVNDITETLVFRIIYVNGVDAETSGRTGYIKITPTNEPITVGR